MSDKKFYTSDLHFQHHNLYLSGKRKFSCAEECEELIVNNFNSRIGKQDSLYILGDLTLSANYDDLCEYLNRINGNKIVILGNHDRQKTLQKLKDDKVISNWHPWKGVADHGIKCFLTHFVPLEAHSGPEPRLYLHGHVHGTLKNITKCPLLYDVGVDANDFKPVSLDDLNLDLISKVLNYPEECPFKEDSTGCKVCSCRKVSGTDSELKVKRFEYQKFRKPRGGETFNQYFRELALHIEKEFERLLEERL